MWISRLAQPNLQGVDFKEIPPPPPPLLFDVLPMTKIYQCLVRLVECDRLGKFSETCYKLLASGEVLCTTFI